MESSVHDRPAPFAATTPHRIRDAAHGGQDADAVRKPFPSSPRPDAIDPMYDLERFVIAQDPVYEDVLRELRDGEKTTHWMWFVFPQLAGLGRSGMSQRFAIQSRAEAEAYLRHAILGPRLEECTSLVIEIQRRTLEQIFGSVDALKFLSSMTLFAAVSDDGNPFSLALEKYSKGQPDQQTLDLLSGRR